MKRRDVVIAALKGEAPPYTPWAFSFTHEANAKLLEYFGGDQSALEGALHSHLAGSSGSGEAFTDLGGDCFRDGFGVVWDRSKDKDIGVVKELILKEPDLRGLRCPDVEAPGIWQGVESMTRRHPDEFRIFRIGFSLFERAWTLRGMENLLMDFHEHPDFVRELLAAIADYNIEQVRRAVKYDIDAVYFGDDWGQQKGLIMGPAIWRDFIKPELTRMYGEVRGAGKFVFAHSCGDVDELFGDLVEAGLNCFNPFQPEVMDVESQMKQWRGRLSFHGGLSTQKTLPYGTVEEVRAESRHLLELGRAGNYIFAPAHSVEGDVPLENLLAFINEARGQAGLESV
ncbi:MAG: uroporphyrinogen-III decarboxylase-like protein [Planctomycetes bacterium]|nr:uroporphyrinogen-III decarboxylase-like protein [Planctomycetota bacterium]